MSKIDGTNFNVQDYSIHSQPSEGTATKKMNPIFESALENLRKTKDDGETTVVNNYGKFNSLLKDSPIGKKFMTETDAARKGFTPTPGVKVIQDEGEKFGFKTVPDPTSQLMDMNGGLHYENKKTGETLRICEFENSVTYTKGNKEQIQYYNEDGSPSGGVISVKDPKTGKITMYNYKNDIDGNPFVVSVKTKQGEPEVQEKKDDKTMFNDALKETVLSDKFSNPRELLAKGWEKSMYMDMNGGEYYTDPKTGTTVRVVTSRILGDGKAMSVKTENMAHFAKYDDNGKETGGVIQIRQDDGTIKVYDYEVDIDGNRFITSVEVSDLDYFADYE